MIQLDYGDPERLVVIALLVASMWLICREKRYARIVKLIKFVPRTYLLAYYLIVVLDLYHANGIETLVRSGIVNVYGIMLLFIAEVYLQWANKQYGQR